MNLLNKLFKRSLRHMKDYGNTFDEVIKQCEYDIENNTPEYQEFVDQITKDKEYYQQLIEEAEYWR